MKKRKGIKLKCNNRVFGKLCGYSWTYRGKQRFYGNCPKCLRKVKIEDYDIKKKIIKKGRFPLEKQGNKFKNYV